MGEDKFLEPVDNIVIVKKTTGPRTLLNEETLEIGRSRVAAGEDPKEVAMDLAIYEASLIAPEDVEEVLRDLQRRGETEVHDAADAYLPILRSTLNYAFTRGRMVAQKKALLNATTEDEASEAMGAVAAEVETTLQRNLPPQLQKVFDDGGHAATERMYTLRAAKRETKKLRMSFTKGNTRAIEWAKKHAGELISDISKTTRQAISEAIVEGFKSGNVRNAYKKILAAVGDEDRAELIARTESMRAANAGQREAWAQATENGLLDGTESRVWIATPDESVCPKCAELDGQTAPLGGEYPDGNEGPPLHPRCRCTEGLQP